MNENPAASQDRTSILTFAIAKSLAISTIEHLNKSDIKTSIASDKAHKSAVEQMVHAQLQESIFSKA